jgi:hypothetical protein
MTVMRISSLVLCALVAGSARASDFPFRTELDLASAKGGLRATSVALLYPKAGPGARVTAGRALEKYRLTSGAITTQGTSTVRLRANKLRYLGSGWYLESLGDGSALRYRNLTYLAKAARAGYPVSAKLPNDKLEQLGRAFIEKELAEWLPMGTGESLVAFESSYRVDSDEDDGAPESATQTLGASTVVFSRTIQGQAVVGAGSKVAIIFAADGVVAGFDLDWPALAPSAQAQKVLDVASIQERAMGVLEHDPFGSNSRLKRLECGYFDGGARRRSPTTPIQPACFYHVLHAVPQSGASLVDPHLGWLRSGFLSVVPAGASVLADAHWREAMLLCVDARGCGVEPTTPAEPINGRTVSTPSSD